MLLLFIFVSSITTFRLENIIYRIFFKNSTYKISYAESFRDRIITDSRIIIIFIKLSSYDRKNNLNLCFTYQILLPYARSMILTWKYFITISVLVILAGSSCKVHYPSIKMSLDTATGVMVIAQWFLNHLIPDLINTCYM